MTIAFAVKIAKREYEHALTRFLLAALYLYFTFGTNIPEDLRQVLIRWFIVLLAAIEIISYVFRRLVLRGNR